MAVPCDRKPTGFFQIQEIWVLVSTLSLTSYVNLASVYLGKNKQVILDIYALTACRPKWPVRLLVIWSLLTSSSSISLFTLLKPRWLFGLTNTLAYFTESQGLFHLLFPLPATLFLHNFSWFGFQFERYNLREVFWLPF